MNTKKWIGIIFLSTMLFSMTGCMRVYETIAVYPDDTISVTVKEGVSKEYIDSQGGTTNPDAKLETLEDGKEYYTVEETQKGSLHDSSTNSDYRSVITKDIFYYSIVSGDPTSGRGAATSKSSFDSNGDLAQAIANGIYVQMKIQLAGDIADSNANAEVTGNTAVFNTDNPPSTAWYAYTAAGKQQIENDRTAPTIQGVKQNNYYKAMPHITCTDNTAVCKVELNGIQVTPHISTNNENGKLTTVYDWYGVLDSVSKSAKKQGKNIFTAYDLSGNSSSVTFYLDTKAPVVKGVKKNKTYKKQAVLYVKDAAKLSKVTIDKKKQTLSNKKLVKKGNYKGYYKFKITKAGKHKVIAYDSAGNKTTISFQVAK